MGKIFLKAIFQFLQIMFSLMRAFDQYTVKDYKVLKKIDMIAGPMFAKLLGRSIANQFG